MPLEIIHRTLTPEDKVLIKDTGGFAKITIPYVKIHEWGYGRMDASSRGLGLATDCMASCIAVVIHCPTTGRTTLSHSGQFMNLRTTFVPMIDWVTGGSGAKVSTSEAATWMTGLGAPGPQELQVVVLKGLEHSEDGTNHGHKYWMEGFRQFFTYFTGPRQIKAEIASGPVVSSSAIAVDKTTARITCFVLPPILKEAGLDVIGLDHPFSDILYSHSQRSQDQFIGNMSYGAHNPVDINVQFDGKRYIQAQAMTDKARYLIRSKAMGEPREAQSAILKRFGPKENDWIKRQGDKVEVINMAFEDLMEEGPPCEKCGEKGEKKCGSCKGAWYCSAAHQKEDWASHKTWCKTHRL